jgi:predicted ATPase
VLNRIAENPAHKERLLKFVRSVLPFVEDIRAERFADKSVIFSLREMYHKKRFLPASMISDGTVGVLAMIIALYLESNSLVIFEEPERNIHPSLLAHVVAMMKDASEHKQVLVTTHNPEFVKHAGVEHLLLISRDSEGFSVITRPAEREDVRIFLENEIGIEDIYVQNLLGA